jgi:DNA-directed RNA polymerase I, II, and III subunit RPABC5
MNCGLPLADKWRWFQKRVAELRREKGLGNETIYIDGTTIPETPERQACDELGITRYCCRKHLLTHRDLIEKI